MTYVGSGTSSADCGQKYSSCDACAGGTGMCSYSGSQLSDADDHWYCLIYWQFDTWIFYVCDWAAVAVLVVVVPSVVMCCWRCCRPDKPTVMLPPSSASIYQPQPVVLQAEPQQVAGV